MNKREIVQLAPMQSLTFGERDGKMSDRVRAIADILASGNFGSQATRKHSSGDVGEVGFPGHAGGLDQLMRAPVGPILASPGGRDFLLGMRDECASVATAAGFAPRAAVHGPDHQHASPPRARRLRPRCSATSRSDAPIEADHVIGDLIARGESAKAPVPQAAHGLHASRRPTRSSARRNDGHSSSAALQNEKPAGQRAFVKHCHEKILERAKGFEPSTPTLARSCSTTELHPHPRG